MDLHIGLEPEGDEARPVPTAHEARSALAAMPVILTPTHLYGPSPRVQLAYSFVRHCNEQMGLRSFTWSDQSGLHCKQKTQELHPKQEAVFRDALGVLHSYFTGKEQP